jgi:hypothetical protein
MVFSKDIKSKFVILEPGDMTRYQFVISESPDEDPDFILIANAGDSPKFDSYLYRRASIKGFFNEVGKPPKLKKDYSKWADKKEVMDNPFLDYVISHSGNCNPFTAIAGLICGLIFISDEEIDVGKES